MSYTWFGQGTSSDGLLPSNCSGLNIVNCTDYNITSPTEWMETSQTVIYIAFPIMLCMGVFFGIINIVIYAQQLRVSHDSYLLGLSISSTLLLATAAILKSPKYVGHGNWYEYMKGYTVSVEGWLWYTSLWLIAIMTLERGMNVIHNRPRSFCSPTQASVAVVMIYLVCLVSALPHFWEFEVVETTDYTANVTTAKCVPSDAADTPEYKVMYFWYLVTITMFLAYPMLFVMLILLSKGMQHSKLSKRRLSVKHGTGQILTRKVREELHMTRLFVAIIIFYYIFTGPKSILSLVDHISPSGLGMDPALAETVKEIFEFAFYFNFAIYFLLFLSYGDRFRQTFLGMCCRCCSKKRKRRR